MDGRRHRSIEKKDKLKGLALCIALIIFIAASGIGMKIWEDRHYAAPESDYQPNIRLPEIREIEADGIRYRQRTDVYAYLLIGVDRDGRAESNGSYIQGGQGDVQMLLVIDDENRSWRVLQLNRDTIADIPVLGVFGDVVSTEKEQLALAHSYGDGMEKSCENNVNAVSALLYDQPLQGYAALNMDAIRIITDEVGGVSIVPQADFDDNGLVLKKGKRTVLDGNAALIYVRARMSVDDGTNPARMARQRIYMSGLRDKLVNSDADTVNKLYDAVGEYMVTDLSDKDVSVIANKLRLYDEKELMTIDGEARTEDGYWAYYLDEKSLLDTVLELFYEKE